MSYSLVNKLRTVTVVPIIRADGTKDSVNIMPRSKVTLEAGAVVDPFHEKVIMKNLVKHEKKRPSAPTPAPAPTTA